MPGRQFICLPAGPGEFNVPGKKDLLLPPFRNVKHTPGALMPHALTELRLAEVTRPAAEGAHEIRADVCVVGAGIAGLSAALESARLGRDVVLVDALPLIGGQMVHSLIGLFCGVFGNAPAYTQLTHGVFDDIFRDLGATGDVHYQRGHTTTRSRSGGGWRRRCWPRESARFSAASCSTSTSATAGSGRSRWPPATGTSRWPRRASSTPAATPLSPGRQVCRAGSRNGRSTARSRSSSRTSTRARSLTPARWTPASPKRPRSTGCCAGAGWPSSTPAGAPRCST